VVAVLILLSTGTAVAARPADHRIAGAAALLFAGLIVAYVATRTMGIPLLSPDPEAVDAVGVATNLVEVLGFACALMLTQPSRRHPGRAVSQEVTSPRLALGDSPCPSPGWSRSSA
jgi:hypothetical protein